jgi:hypothetical protein
LVVIASIAGMEHRSPTRTFLQFLVMIAQCHLEKARELTEKTNFSLAAHAGKTKLVCFSRAA